MYHFFKDIACAATMHSHDSLTLQRVHVHPLED